MGCQLRREPLRPDGAQVEPHLVQGRDHFRVDALPRLGPSHIARAWPGSASWLKSAAAICDRPALWIQAKSTVTAFMVPGLRGQHLPGQLAGASASSVSMCRSSAARRPSP